MNIVESCSSTFNLSLIPPKMTKLGNATLERFYVACSHMSPFSRPVSHSLTCRDRGRMSPRQSSVTFLIFPLNSLHEPCLAVRIWHAMQLQLHLSPCALQPRVVGQPPSGCGKLWLNQHFMCLAIRKEELYSSIQENLSKWEVLQSFLTFNTCLPFLENERIIKQFVRKISQMVDGWMVIMCNE